MFNGDELAGLVPTLFANDLVAAQAAMLKDPAKLHADVAKLNKSLFISESVTLTEARAILKKPR